MKKTSFLVGMLLVVGMIVFRLTAADPLLSVVESDKNKPQAGTQAMRSFVVHVTNENNKPVADVLVTPWALRCSQGHGLWQDDDKWATVGPKAVRTDEKGNAVIAYPYYRDVKEAVRTISVSIKVSHPEYALPDAYHIDVPLQESPFEVDLKKGASIELRPTIEGKPTDVSQVYANWSDARSNDPTWTLQRTDNSTLRLPPMTPESQSVIVAKFDGDQVTHLSSIINFDLKPDVNQSLDVSLKPVRQIKGTLDASVPRPVLNGRVQVRTIPKPDTKSRQVGWSSWAPVTSDGAFTIADWPQGESLQVIAICQGYIASSGTKPTEYVENRPPNLEAFHYPQCFGPDTNQITLTMEPLIKCTIKTLDDSQQPVAGVRVITSPNVQWWNTGSQIYCAPGNSMLSSEYLKTRVRPSSTDDSFNPFEGKTDQAGQVVLYLPTGRQYFGVIDDSYEMPISLGQREIKRVLQAGDSVDLALNVQLKGTEMLGDWDKLAGVVFGCSTREGRRICALPEVRAKMDELQVKFQDAKNRNDPKLLADAYTVVATAFANANDLEESIKWQLRAQEQSKKAADSAK